VVVTFYRFYWVGRHNHWIEMVRRGRVRLMAASRQGKAGAKLMLIRGPAGVACLGTE
jgi:hypothetical protein